MKMRMTLSFERWSPPRGPQVLAAEWDSWPEVEVAFVHIHVAESDGLEALALDGGQPADSRVVAVSKCLGFFVDAERVVSAAHCFSGLVETIDIVVGSTILPVKCGFNGDPWPFSGDCRTGGRGDRWVCTAPGALGDGSGVLPVATRGRGDVEVCLLTESANARSVGSVDWALLAKECFTIKSSLDVYEVKSGLPIVVNEGGEIKAVALVSGRDPFNGGTEIVCTSLLDL